MRHFLIYIAVFFALISSSAQAALDGGYFGGQGGWTKLGDITVAPSDQKAGLNTLLGTTNLPIPFNTFRLSSTGTGYGVRLFVGYQYNCYSALELGYSKLRPMSANSYATGVLLGVPFTSTEEKTMRSNVVDLVVKGILPLKYHFNMYVKGGIAYLTRRTIVTYSLTVPLVGVASFNAQTDTRRFFPTFGAGIAYDISPRWVVDASWNRIQKTGNSPEIGSVDLATVGLTYHCV